MKIGILFDLDGTLLDTLEDLKDSVNYALRQFGYPERTLEEVRQFVGNGAHRLMERAAPQGADVDQIFAEFRAYYDAHCQIKTKPYEGILDALARIQRKYPVAIVSNKPDSAVKYLCAQYFPGIYARGESKDCPRKPAPDMVFKAMEVIGVQKCVYVGDSEVDVLTATNAGAPCVSVLWGFRDQEILAEAGAEFFCEQTREIPGLIEKIAGEINGK